MGHFQLCDNLMGPSCHVWLQCHDVVCDHHHEAGEISKGLNAEMRRGVRTELRGTWTETGQRRIPKANGEGGFGEIERKPGHSSEGRRAFSWPADYKKDWEPAAWRSPMAWAALPAGVDTWLEWVQVDAREKPHRQSTQPMLSILSSQRVELQYKEKVFGF